MHCIRRATLRLLSSPASAPLRSRSAIAINPFPSIRPRQLPLCPLQSRWNSDDAIKRSESHNTEAAEEENFKRDERMRRAVEYEAEPHQDRSNAPRRMRRNQMVGRLPEPKESVFVGNLFYDVTADDLRAQFEAYGVVQKALIVLDNRGLSKGFGYVQFDSTASATKAIEEMHLKVFEGRRISVYYAANNVQRAQTPLQPPSRTLFIGNLPFAITDREMNELFKQITGVIDVRVAIDRATGQPRGFVHAEFISVEAAQAAVEIISLKEPHGRKLRVDFAPERKVERAREPRMPAEPKDNE